MVSFVRSDASSTYLVAVSLSDEDLDAVAQSPLPSPIPNGTPKLVWGDGKLEGGRLTLPAHGSAVFDLR